MPPAMQGRATITSNVVATVPLLVSPCQLELFKPRVSAAISLSGRRLDPERDTSTSFAPSLAPSMHHQSGDLNSRFGTAQRR
ncbi:hypothetical protein OH77DRAFT_1423995 [Trametes cingulata]|nr:hypothetical protein OH77DRAFT_1423995 [Trametes cingulata]